MTATTQPQPAVGKGHMVSMDIYFDDLDSMGIVHNTRYPVLVERALSSFWNKHGYGYANGVLEHPDAFVAVAEFAISYRMPISGTVTIGVNFWCEKVGESSVVYAFRIESADGATVHAEGRRVHIRLDPKTLRPVPWAPETRAIYETLSSAS